MRAVPVRGHGGPEVLELVDVPRPEMHEGETVIRVRACGVNHLDVHIRRGLENIDVPLPHIPGSDIAGDVAYAPPGSGLEEGQRVVIAPGLSCGKCLPCLQGQDHLCAAFGVIGGYRVDGGYAEFVSVPTRNVLPLPEGVSFVDAAAMPTTYQTAWHMLVERARVRPGQRVLIHAAGSGVGAAAIEIASFLGAQIVATAGADEKLDLAAERGAHHLINYQSDDFSSSVRRLFGSGSMDVVIEQVGTPVFWESAKLLRSGGTLVTCGSTAGHSVDIDLRYLYSRNLTLAGSSLGPISEFHTLVGLLGAGRIAPLIDSVLPLGAARQAHERLESRQVVGKIVLTPSRAET